MSGITDPAELYFKDGRWGYDGTHWQPMAAYPADVDRGIAQIGVRQTAATAAAAVVWALRSKTAGKTLYIRRIWLQLWFDGTGAATEMSYELIKGAACTAMSGGVAVAPLIKRTGLTNPDVDCRVLDTGLTLTGVALGSPFWRAAWARLTHSATQAGGIGPPFCLDFMDQPIELVQNEVLALRNVNASVIGDNISGGCDFCGGVA